MHPLSIIDPGPKAYETLAATKPVAQKREDFGKLLNEKHPPRPAQTEPQKPAADKPAAVAQGKPASEPQTHRKESPSDRNALTDKQAAQKKHPDQAVAAPEVQHQLVQLLKIIAGGETAESIEQFGSIEAQLTQLVQQLDSSDLQGAQVLAGIDLSTLIGQLQTSAGGENGEEQLTHLATRLAEQLNEQLNSDENLLAAAELGSDSDLQTNADQNSDVAVQANAELAAASLGSGPQMNPQRRPEDLGQARQLLQKVLDSVAGQNSATEQQVVVEDEVADQESLAAADGETELDPRFASLLKPREVAAEPLRARVQANSAQPATVATQANGGAEGQTAAAVSSEPGAIDAADLVAAKPQQQAETLVQQLQGNGQQSNQPAETVRSMPTSTPSVLLPSGQQVAESQIFDQVVTRMSGSLNGESGKMMLRLQPAELGSLRLELTIEGDKVRASLLAQTQQVQEVLERNLPQLRSALAEQGLKIDQFQVDVDSRQGQQGQFDQQAQQQKQNQSAQAQTWLQPAEEQTVPLGHLMQNGGGGISLHV